jgi:hypothetical protein
MNMETKRFRVSDEIVVLGHTKLSDLKPGDLVMTAEIMEVIKVKSRGFITCTIMAGRNAPCVKELGWGQQSVLKVIRGATLAEKYRYRPRKHEVKP